MKCVNPSCNKNAVDSLTKILVSCDGDFVCSPECNVVFDKFKSNINNMTDDKFEQFMVKE